MPAIAVARAPLLPEVVLEADCVATRSLPVVCASLDAEEDEPDMVEVVMVESMLMELVIEAEELPVIEAEEEDMESELEADEEAAVEPVKC